MGPVADDVALKICAALPGMLAAPHALVCWRPYDRSADGLNRPKSDIDLAVAGCPDFNRLEQNLQDNLWSLLKVDVINLDEPISSSLRAEIERSGKVLYEKI